MIVARWKCVPIVFWLLAAWTASPSSAQPPTRLSKVDAPLVVEGIVREIFRSPRQGQTDYLLQIDVLRSEGRKFPVGGGRRQFPGPGESVYVHVSQRTDAAGQVIAADSHEDLPSERAQVRVYLIPREQGGWEGAFSDWFDPTADRLVEASPQDPAPSILESAANGSDQVDLGMTTEVLKVDDRVALRVTSVERGGAAQESGLEVGDIIAGIDGAAITDAKQLDTVAAKGKKFSLIVVDVNTGRGAQVEIDPTQPPTAAAAANAPTTAPPKVSLGISAEPVALGSRSALKVTRVDPAGPAAKAGLEVGDIVVAANGAPLTGPEQLLGALRKSGPTLKLTVRDSRTGRDAEVAVNVGGATPAKPLPADVNAPSAAAPSKLGAVTELAFHDDDFALKVTEVETDSPAARAGLRPGLLILTANGKPMFHSSELNDVIRTSGGKLKLTILNPTTGKKSDTDVTLGK